jgi:4-diphosphocytidyl-2-C-methyl-D-erythritol kinase
MVKIIGEKAPAKINLYLRVVGRRADGYHELDSVMFPLSLCDELSLELRPASARAVTIRCDRPGIPSDDRNLAARAARRFMEEFSGAYQIAIELRKQIPAGAGLGGGSSDAGAVIRAMAALLRVNDRARLIALAASIGADVPFFIDPRPARIGGIGERIATLTNPPRLELVIAVPPIEVATAGIFAALQREDWSGPPVDTDLSKLGGGRIPESMLVNDLGAAAAARHPEILKLKALLKESGAHAAAMSGSGGAVFGIFGSVDQAARAAEFVRTRSGSASVFVTHTIQSLIEIDRL